MNFRKKILKNEKVIKKKYKSTCFFTHPLFIWHVEDIPKTSLNPYVMVSYTDKIPPGRFPTMS